MKKINVNSNELIGYLFSCICVLTCLHLIPANIILVIPWFVIGMSIFPTINYMLTGEFTGGLLE